MICQRCFSDVATPFRIVHGSSVGDTLPWGDTGALLLKYLSDQRRGDFLAEHLPINELPAELVRGHPNWGILKQGKAIMGQQIQNNPKSGKRLFKYKSSFECFFQPLDALALSKSSLASFFMRSCFFMRSGQLYRAVLRPSCRCKAIRVIP